MRGLQPGLLLKNFHERRNFSSSQTRKQRRGVAPAESPAAVHDRGALSFCDFLGIDECVIKLHIFTHSFSNF